jgi:hypothetical protein
MQEKRPIDRKRESGGSADIGKPAEGAIIDMIWIKWGLNIVEGIVDQGPNAELATASFYRQWYKEKVLK